MRDETSGAGPEIRILEDSRSYWIQIAELRSDPRVQSGFRNEVVSISQEQQIEYMERWGACYVVALSGDRLVGFAGVVEGDIRVCVEPEQQGRGVAKALISELKIRHPDAEAVVRWENSSSWRLFEGLGYQPRYGVYSRD